MLLVGSMLVGLILGWWYWVGGRLGAGGGVDDGGVGIGL